LIHTHFVQPELARVRYDSTLHSEVVREKRPDTGRAIALHLAHDLTLLVVFLDLHGFDVRHTQHGSGERLRAGETPRDVVDSLHPVTLALAYRASDQRQRNHDRDGHSQYQQHLDRQTHVLLLRWR